jgi:hypothetical protein
MRVLCVGVVVLVVFTGRPAAASCAVFEIDSGFRDAKAVFVGQVMATRVVQSANDSFDVRTVATVRVERRWKGPSAKALEVSACGGGGVVCTVSIDFEIGRRYLFFAEGNPLSTSSCMSWPVETASTELRWLARKRSTQPG